MSGLCTFIPNNRQANLMIEIWRRYRAGEPTAETLRDLRDELGQQEFANFELDLAELLKKNRAPDSMSKMISRALGRKREEAAARGSRSQLTESKIGNRMRRAEAALRADAE